MFLPDNQGAWNLLGDINLREEGLLRQEYRISGICLRLKQVSYTLCKPTVNGNQVSLDVKTHTANHLRVQVQTNPRDSDPLLWSTTITSFPKSR